MRIAVTYPDVHLVGGVERVVVECANFLARRGHDVHAFAVSFDEDVLDARVQRHPVAAPRRPDAAFPLRFRRAATRTLQAAGPFDVHASFSALSPLGGVFWTPSVHAEAYEAALRWRTGARRLAVQANPYHRVRLRLERELYSAGGYARVIAQTEEVKREVVRHYGVPETDIDVLPLGFDPAVFSADRRAELRERARAELGYAPGDRVIVFVANELERKGYDTLLRALARLPDTAARLHVVGRVEPGRYAALAQELGLDGRVRFAGSTPDVGLHHAAADAFALPTRYEPWGLVIVEALASGLPVVTTRLAGAGALVQEGRTGALLDDPEDHEALATQLAWALGEDRAGAEEISASVAELTWDKVLLRWEEILAGVASRDEDKPTGYYGAAREDVVAELPRPLGRVLDVGCGAGGVGRSLRNAGASELVGVEVFPEAAEEARSVFDEVVAGTIEDALASGALRGPFDTIACYDVLEHLVDPEAVLRALLPLAAPGGRLHVSVPNARHFSLVADLLLRGTFGYTEYGHRDATHLRWFTRADIVAAVAAAGWEVQSWAPNTFRGRDRPVDRLTAGRARELIALQWHVLARAPGESA
jgi:UDP-glucose:(heptosyl)LPS alpha-1,3-glucosyltransferase